jgi:hypothetical protein
LNLVFRSKVTTRVKGSNSRPAIKQGNARTAARSAGLNRRQAESNRVYSNCRGAKEEGERSEPTSSSAPNEHN